MANVFKKLISKELGEINYRRYFCFVKKNFDNRISDSQTLYNDIYEKLKYRDIKSITKMHNRLNDTMLLAFRISKTYFFAFLVYLSACIFLISRTIRPDLTILSLILMSICFLYKTYEFLANKFCFIDAQIVLVYKAVLDKIILSQHQNNSQ